MWSPAEQAEIRRLIAQEAARARRMLAHEEPADLVQVGWAVALRVRRSYRPDRGEFLAYLRVCLRHHYFTAARRPPLPTVPDPDIDEDMAEDPAELALEPLPRLAVEEAYAALIRTLRPLPWTKAEAQAFFVGSGLLGGPYLSSARCLWVLGFALRTPAYRKLLFRARQHVRGCPAATRAYRVYIQSGPWSSVPSARIEAR